MYVIPWALEVGLPENPRLRDAAGAAAVVRADVPSTGGPAVFRGGLEMRMDPGQWCLGESAVGKACEAGARPGRQAPV